MVILNELTGSIAYIIFIIIFATSINMIANKIFPKKVKVVKND